MKTSAEADPAEACGEEAEHGRCEPQGVRALVIFLKVVYSQIDLKLLFLLRRFTCYKSCSLGQFVFTKLQRCPS